MSVVRAFISFQMEDQWAREFLKEHARQKTNDVEFEDYSVQDPFDSSWKTQCKKRIALTAGTIVLVGEDTSNSDAVVWEIEESASQNHPLFGIYIRKNEPALPSGLTSSSMVHWDFDAIVDRLAQWG